MLPIVCLDITHFFSYHFPPYKTTKQQNLVKKKKIPQHPSKINANSQVSTLLVVKFKCHYPSVTFYILKPKSDWCTCDTKSKRNNMSITFLQQILSGRLLLVVIVGAKK